MGASGSDRKETLLNKLCCLTPWNLDTCSHVLAHIRSHLSLTILSFSLTSSTGFVGVLAWLTMPFEKSCVITE